MQLSRPIRVTLTLAIAATWAAIGKAAHWFMLAYGDWLDHLSMAWGMFVFSSTLAVAVSASWALSNGRSDGRASSWLLTIGLAALPCGLTLYPGFRWVQMDDLPGWLAGLSFGGSAVWIVGVLWWFSSGGLSDQRRCRRCTYDMSDTPGLRCSECGHESRREQDLMRGGRSKWLGRLAVLFVLLTIPALRLDAIRWGGWRGAIPTTVIVLGYPVMPEGAVLRNNWFQNTDPWSLESRLSNDDSVWDWQLDVLAWWIHRGLNNRTDLRTMHRAMRLARFLDSEVNITGVAERVDMLVPIILEGRMAEREQARAVMYWLSQIADVRASMHPHVGTIASQVGSDHREHETALAMLLRHSPPALVEEDLLPRLKEFDRGTLGREVAVSTLGRAAAIDPSFVERLIGGLDDLAPNHRGCVIEILLYAYYNEAAFDPAFLEILIEVVRNDPDQSVRSCALETMPHVIRVEFDRAALWDQPEPAVSDRVARACHALVPLLETGRIELNEELRNRFVRLASRADDDPAGVAAAAVLAAERER